MSTNRPTPSFPVLRALRQGLPWLLALAVATCTTDREGPSDGGVGYFAFRPVYHLAGGSSLGQFGIVADSIHIRLTRPIDQLVLDTTVFFPPDSTSLHLALPVQLIQTPETLTAVIAISAGGTVIFLDSVQAEVKDGPPGSTTPPTVVFDYVGPGNNIGTLVVTPADTTIVLGDTLFFTAAAFDSSLSPVSPFYVGWKTTDTSVAKINAAGRLIAPALRGSVRVVGTTPTGIADTTLVLFAPVPVVIFADSGNAQGGAAGDSLGLQFVARVKAADSLGVEGIAVRFQTVTGGGAIRDTLLFTDANGRVRTRGVFGTVLGSNSWSATVVGTGLSTTFTATAAANAAVAIAIQAGNAQTDTAGQLLPLPFTVRVADAFNNPVNGAKVYWTRLAGTGTLSVDSSNTNASGLASAGYTLGSPGTDTVHALLAGTSAFANFTVTAVVGGATALNYVSGTGQTGTVGTGLAVPLIVQATGAGSTPVAGAWVRFVMFTGGGSVAPDSAQTDSTGVASTFMTLGTVAGLDSIRATIAGLADTVYFYAQAVAGAPAALTIVSGDGQVDTAGTAVTLPLIVRSADAFNNPTAGTIVNFAVVAGGGTIDSATATTGANGQASGGLWTLGAIGANQVRATSPATPADTLLFDATALPAGTSKLWTGATDNLWTTATNWSPAGVPSTSDNVYIPAGVTTPSLFSTSNTRDLTIESGAALNTGSYVLNIGGNLDVAGTIVGAGFPVMNGAGKTLRGSISTYLGVSGTITLNGPFSTTGQLDLTAGSLTVGGQALTVGGQLTVGGSAALTMQNTADSVTVAGPTTYNGSAAAGLLTAGKLVLLGDFNEPSGSAVFSGGSGHTTIFAGSVPQTVTFASASLAGNRFGNVVFANPAGVTLGGNMAATGTATVAAGVVTGAGRTAFLGGSLDDATSLGWNVATTSLAGTPALLPDTILGNLDLTGTVTLAKSIVVKGNLTPSASSVLTLNGFGIRVEGAMNVSSAAQVKMQSAADTLDVAGATTWNGSSAAGLLTSGTLIIRGNFSEPSGSAVFIATGTHTTVFAGTSPQAVSFGSQSLGGNHFQDLVVTNAAGVNFTSGGSVAGNATIAGGVVTSNANQILTVNGDLTDPTNGSWRPEVTSLTGTPTVLPDSFTRNVTMSGTIALGHAVAFQANLSQTGGSLTLNGFHVRVDSALNVSGIAQLKMQNAADTLDVAGAATWNGSTTAGLLTAGTLIVRGNFSEPSGSAVFIATGTHTTVFAGATAQTVTFGSQSLAGNHFQDLVIANSAGVNFTSGGSAAGNASIAGGVITSNANQILTVNGDLTDATGTSWRPEVTSLTGTPTVLPDSFTRNVTMSGTIALGHAVAFRANLSQTGGSFTINGFHVRIDSALNVSGIAQLKMQNAADTVDVGGTTTWNGSTATGLLTAGTLIVRGNFSEPSGSAVFQASGTHTTLFAGATAQTVTFGSQSLAGNHFQDLIIANAAGVNFTSGGSAAGNAFISGGVITSNANQTLTVNGNLTDTTGTSWRPENTNLTGTPSILPDSFVRNVTMNGTVTLPHSLAIQANLTQAAGVLTVNGFHLRVDSALTVSGTSQFKMQNGADTVDVGGTTTWNGSTATGLLTAGTLVLRGDFSEPSGSSVFQASGTHRTVLAPSGAQTVGFAATSFGANRFNDLVLTGAGSETLTSDLFVAGTFTKAAGPQVALAGSGAVRTLAVRGLSLDGVVFDSVRVTKSGPATTTFNNVTFQRQDPATIQLVLTEPGTAAPVTFNGVQFTTVPTTGKYLSATDSAADGNPVHILFAGSLPLDGTPFELLLGGGDGTTIDWSSLAFATQPVTTAQNGLLAPVRVAVVGPAGDTVTAFTGPISVSLANNPVGATLSGSTTRNAVAGIATFDSLSLDNAGIGFTLSAITGGATAVISAPFDVQVLLPSGFNVAWNGSTSSDWHTAANWDGGAVPLATDNVYIPATSQAPIITASDTVLVKRLRTAPGAGMTVLGTVVADSSVETADSLGGSGMVVLVSSGTIKGGLPQVKVLGAYALGDTASAAAILVTGAGQLDLNGMQFTAGNFTTQSGGTLRMVQSTDELVVLGTAAFFGGSTAGLLTDGQIFFHGAFNQSGDPQSFFATGAHTSRFVGTGIQVLTFSNVDTVAGSHFQDVEFAGGDTLLLGSPALALGATQVDNGTTLVGNHFLSVGAFGVQAGATVATQRLTLGSTFTITGTFAVPKLELTGAGGALGLPALPYDTLIIGRLAFAAAPLTVTGDLRVDGGAGIPARFSLNGQAVVVQGSAFSASDGAFVMQNSNDVLTVAKDFHADGTSTYGLMTAGLLEIGGSFHQTSDFGGGSFRADSAHVTRFFGATAEHNIQFDTPSFLGGVDSLSRFGSLELVSGTDSLNGAISVAGTLTSDATLTQPLEGSAFLDVAGALTIDPATPAVNLTDVTVRSTLAVGTPSVWTGVNRTTYSGGATSVVPLPYNNLRVLDANVTAAGDLNVAGNFDVGLNPEIGDGPAAKFTFGGHTVTVGVGFSVQSLGQIVMATGDSLDAGNSVSIDGDVSTGLLTGGTVVSRGYFAAQTTRRDSTWLGQAVKLVFANSQAQTWYVTERSGTGIRFGTVRLDGSAPVSLSVGTSDPVVVTDSLVLPGAGADLESSGSVVKVLGPVVVGTGSTLTASTLELSDTLDFGSANWNVGLTRFMGPTQTVTAGPAYQDVDVVGTAKLDGNITLGAGNTFTVGAGFAGPSTLTLGGHTLRTGHFVTTGQGALVMTLTNDSLVSLASASFDGRSEAFLLNDGVHLSQGNLTQGNTTSDSSYFGSGAFMTSLIGSDAVVDTVQFATGDGRSRFNSIQIDGDGVRFATKALVFGSASVNSAGTVAEGPYVSIRGGLFDGAYRWLVDTTEFTGFTPTLPDSITGSVIFANGVNLGDSLRVGGLLRATGDTLALNGHLVRAHGDFDIGGTGIFTMVTAGDTLLVDGSVTINGANAVQNLTAGLLRIDGGLTVGAISGFDAGGTHQTVMNGGSSSVIDFTAPGNAFQHFDYLDGTKLASDVRIRGNLTGSGETAGQLYGVDSMLTLDGTVEQGITFDSVRVTLGEGQTLFDVRFQDMDQTRDQLTVVGAGSPSAPMDLAGLRFATIPTTGHFVAAKDTVANGDSLIVRLFNSDPLQAPEYGLGIGEAAVRWSHIVFSAQPATVDSGFVMTPVNIEVRDPAGNVSTNTFAFDLLALGSNPGGATLNGTVNGSVSSGQGSFTDLSLTGALPGIGYTFFVTLNGQATDTASSAPFDLNALAAGTAIFDGSTSSNWSDTTNWSTGTVPSGAVNAYIPAGQFVELFGGTVTVNDLRLGANANIQLDPGAILTVQGNLDAGNTVSGSGELDLVGAGTFTGSLPSTRILGARTAVGTVNISGDLIVDTTAELNVGGAHITATGNFATLNGGFLTMDSPTDTLSAYNAYFLGGADTTLTAGVLFLNGPTFQQGGLVRASFAPRGSFTTVFLNAGVLDTLTFQGADSSHFQHLRIENPSGAQLSGDSGTARIMGDLTLTSGALLTGYHVEVGGNITAPVGTTLSPTFLKVGGALDLQGTLDPTVFEVQFVGTGQSIPALPYNHLRLSGSEASLAGNITATSLDIDGDTLPLGGHTVHVGNFGLSGLGLLTMDQATDTLIVDTAATFYQDSSEFGQLTAGFLRVQGSLYAPFGTFQAGVGHTTQFAGPGQHLLWLSSAPIFVECQGPCIFPPLIPNHFGQLRIDSTTVTVVDSSGHGSVVAGDLQVVDGAIVDTGRMDVEGDVHVDATSALSVSLLGVRQLLDFQAPGGNYLVTDTRYTGTGQNVPVLPYQTLSVTGDASLTTSLQVQNAALLGTGRLALGGHTLTVDTLFTANDSSHILMQDPNDSLLVLGQAFFQADSTEGDFTAGVIRAQTFVQSVGQGGSPRGFVETGSHRIAPMLGDTIRMSTGGPTGSRLKTIDFGTAAGNVVIGGTLWVTDTLRIADGDTYVSSDSLTEITAGTAVLSAGGIGVHTLGILGSIDYTGGSYDVGLTRFTGDIVGGQIVPNTVPYRDIEVQFAAALGGTLDLYSGGHTLIVDSLGLFDLAGHTLFASKFETQGHGRLTMVSAADTLSALNAQFDGGSTSGLLTDGVLQVGNFEQSDVNDTLSFAPSGAHVTEFVTIGLQPESGYSLTMAPSAGAAGSHFHRLHLLSTAGTRIFNDIWVADSLFANNSLFGTSYTVTGAGAIVIGNAADVQLDTLRVLGSLDIDPSATYSVTNTVFGPSASPMPAFLGLHNVFIDGAQTLVNPVSVNGDLHVRNTGLLTPAANKVTVAGILYTTDSGRVVLADPADTLQANAAYFDGPATGSDLSAGVLRISAYLTQLSNNSTRSFRPTGTAVEFAGGGNKYTTFTDPDSAASRFFDLRVKDGSSLRVQSGLAVAGRVTVEGGSEFDGGYQAVGIPAIDFYGKVDIQASARITDSIFNLVAFHDSLLVGVGASYNIINTAFQGTDGVPDASYYHLYLRTGVHLALTHPLTVLGGLNIQNPDVTDTVRLRLNGNTVTATGMYMDGYARITMDDPVDTLQIIQDVTFRGVDEDTAMSAGTLRVGGYLQQIGLYSSKSFAPTGTLTEFFGPVTHNALFANPANGLSSLGPLSVIDNGTLQPSTSMVVTGATTIGNGAHFDGQSVPNAGTVEFYGPVNVLANGDFHSGTSLALFNFSGLNPLTVNGGASLPYDVVSTGFFNTTELPDLPYQNLYLGNGVHDTLALTPTISGLLSLASNTVGGEDFVLNGQSVYVNTLITQGAGRFTMNNSSDYLLTSANATFNGGDLDGRLTDGTIDIGGDFSQDGTNSDKSFRSTGTVVRFTAGTVQQVAFGTPDSSWFATVNGAPATPVVLNITGRARMTGDLSAYGVALTGDTLRVDGQLDSSPIAASVNLKELQVGTLFQFGSIGAFNVGTTQFLGDGTLPNFDFAFDTLIVSGTVDGQLSQLLTANYVEVTGPGNPRHTGPGVGSLILEGGDGSTTLNVSGDVLVSGAGATIKSNFGTLTATGNLVVDSAGLLVSTVGGCCGLSLFDIGGNVTMDGGYEHDSLVNGHLIIGGNFTQLGTTSGGSFEPDSGFVTEFTGAGPHVISFQTPGDNTVAGHSYFGSLAVGSTAMSLQMQGDIYVEGILSTTASNGATFVNTSPTIGRVTTRDVAVQNIAFDHIQLRLQKTTQAAAGAGTMDIVTFANFQSDEIQFDVELPGESTGNFNWSNFTFTPLNPNGLDTGKYIFATDYDGPSPDVLTISLGTSQYTDPGQYFFGFNGAIVAPFGP